MMGPPDAKRSAPGRPTESNACRGGRREQVTPPPPDPEYDEVVAEAEGYESDPLTADWWAAVSLACDRGELEEAPPADDRPLVAYRGSNGKWRYAG